MSTLQDIQHARDEHARMMLEFREVFGRTGRTPKERARIVRKYCAHKLPRTDAESLRRRVARLIRFARSPIPHYLPCGADDAAGEQRDAARQEAARLAAMVKHARPTRALTGEV